jgi:hypothetical protein
MKTKDGKYILGKISWRQRNVEEVKSSKRKGGEWRIQRDFKKGGIQKRNWEEETKINNFFCEH